MGSFHLIAVGNRVDVGGGQYVTTRAFDADGNELWSYDNGVNSGGACIDSDGAIYTIADDGVVRKHDQAGNVEWSVDYAVAIGGAKRNLAVDGAGNLYVTGYAIQASGWPSKHLYQILPDGSAGWSANHPTSDRYGHVSCDAAGHVLAGGNSVSGVSTVYYDTDGSTIWTADHGNDISDTAIGPDGRCYTVGPVVTGVSVRSYSTVDGAPGWTAAWVHATGCVCVAAADDGRTAAGGYREWVAAVQMYVCVRVFDASGQIIWSQTGIDRPQGVAFDADGNLYIGGQNNAAHIKAHEPDGTPLWSVVHGANVNAVAVMQAVAPPTINASGSWGGSTPVVISTAQALVGATGSREGTEATASGTAQAIATASGSWAGSEAIASGTAAVTITASVAWGGSAAVIEALGSVGITASGAWTGSTAVVTAYGTVFDRLGLTYITIGIAPACSLSASITTPTRLSAQVRPTTSIAVELEPA